MSGVYDIIHFMGTIKSLGSFFRRIKKKILKTFSRKEILIVAALIAGAIVAASVVVILRNRASGKPSEDGEGLDIATEEDAHGDESTDGDSLETTIVETASAETKIESTAETTVLALKEDTKEGYINRCVFLGDSRTVAMVNYGLINDDAALAQIGISHPSFKSNTFVNNAGKQYTLKSYLASHQAPVIYIALGVNGINDPSEEHYKSTFEDLIDNVMELSPNSNVVLMSIGPVDDNGAYRKTVQNSWIVKYNDFLLDTAKDRHIFYLNISELLTGSDGQVKSEYNAGDGLHYSSSGCKAIFDYIVGHPVPSISDDGEYVVHYVKPNPNNTKVTMDEGSGIDADKLSELMNMMMEEATPTPTVTATPTTATNNSEAEEEAKRKAEESEKAQKAKEEEARKAKEAADKKAQEEAEKNKKAQEETQKAREAEEAKKAQEEAERKAQEEEQRRQQEEEEQRKQQEEEEQRRQQEEEEQRRQQEEEEREARETEEAKKTQEEAQEEAQKEGE